jgi:hypothetical protein
VRTIRFGMNVVPKNLAEKIRYFEGHVQTWADRAPQIGADPALVAELAAATAAARDAFRAQRQAQATARSATLRMKNAVAEMARLGAGVIQQVKATASVSGDKGVYVLASIPPPAKRSRLGKPGLPYAFDAELGGGGSLKLKWRCDNPRGSKGTMYHVRRRIGWNGPLQFLGAVGVRSFVDTTVPAGTAHLVYQIQANRTTAQGDAAEFIVSLGGESARMPAAMQLRARAARAA